MSTGTQVDFLKYSHTIGIYVMVGRGFDYPSDTAIGKDGRLYVVNRGIETDDRTVRVTVCNLDSEYFGSIGAYGKGDGQFVWPASIALDSLGHVYVSDEHSHLITVLDPSGAFLSKWGVLGAGEGEFDGPSGIAFDSDDNLFVVDQHNSRVQKFTKDGRFILSFGSKGHGDGQLNLPWGVTVDAKGDVYIADWQNDRIQRFSADGEYLSQYGASGSGDGQFHRPASVAVDGAGYIYVADWGNQRVQVLDPEGGFVMKLRGEATNSKWANEFLNVNVEEAQARARSNLEPDLDFLDDPFEESSYIEKLFWAPVSVKLDNDGRLYVTEASRHRIQIYERGS